MNYSAQFVITLKWIDGLGARSVIEISKILVVYDSLAETLQFIVMIELMGHEGITAGDGRDVVKMALAEQPDVVLMEIVMPDMNEFQATR